VPVDNQNSPQDQSPRPSWCAGLKVHPAADFLPMLAESELRELGKSILKNGLLFPITIGRKPGTAGSCADDYELWDGRNRLAALELVGGMETPLTFIPGKRRGRGYSDERWILAVAGHCTCTVHTEMPAEAGEAYDYIIGANIRRRHLTAEQKRELIGKLLKAQPGKSDRQIAVTVNASPTTVGTVRARMEETGDVSKLDTRTDS
jgi:ParB-like nuclease domain